MDLRSRVSSYHLYGPKPYIDKMKKLVDQTLFYNVWPCIDRHSRLNILARGHRVHLISDLRGRTIFAVPIDVETSFY